MKRSTALLAFWMLVCGAAGAQENAQASRWLVEFRPGTTQAVKRQTLAQSGLSLESELSELGITVAAQKPGTVRAEVLMLEASPNVAAVEEDFYAKWLIKDEPGNASPEALYSRSMPTFEDVMGEVEKMPKVERRSTQDTIIIPWGIARLHVPEAQALGLNTGRGVKVAVIDTGIDASHPELAGAVAGGYNARVTASRDNWKDDNGHGTHVSGTIAAAGLRRVVGVAPGVKLYAVKVLDKDGGGFLTDILLGILWCGRNGIQVANMSLGSSRGSFFEHKAIQWAISKGVTFVAAAGNGDDNDNPGPVDYPGAYPEVIAVSALQQATKNRPETITSWSSRGPQVAFIAPGDGVFSTWLNGGYDTLDGTSMATPHVTGMAALAVAEGYTSPAAVRQALTRAAVPVAGLSKDEEGAGVIDARLLLREHP